MEHTRRRMRQRVVRSRAGCAHAGRAAAQGGGGRPARAAAVAALAILSLALVGALPPGRAAAAGPAVGVVDFYAITPVPFAAGVIPERFAADDLSAMLEKAAQDRVTMIPRETVQQAEAALRWREADVLSFARLSALAQRVHADRLVVGWIQRYGVGPEGHHREFPGVGGNMISGYAAVVVQDFDAAQGRIVAQTNGAAYAQGFVFPLVVEDVLHRALEPTVAPTVSSLIGSGS